ncbi:Tropinone reductase-like 3 [Colletotrichum chlorophyti]|uniref:Tropinone reductase-like 3 n=1 Tax=Colletotrichum chlorophyti TaxID=708187 RepID=A0A1Q8S9N0_9PEZI|nr:Tropinone reductase-like 3 [Colletotrichum chlorophyti]
MTLDALPILVIIGAGGIGLATAHRLGANHHILIASRSSSTITSATESLRKAGHKVSTQQVDASSHDSVKHLANTAASLGQVKTVVMTAGLSPTMGSPEEILSVNVGGVASVISVFAGVVSENSVVVCVGSMASSLLPPLSDDLEKHLATAPVGELLSDEAAAASKKFSERVVRVVCVSPGMTDTKMLEAEMQTGNIREMIGMHPLKRAGTVEEIAEAIGFAILSLVVIMAAASSAAAQRRCNIQVRNGSNSITTSACVLAGSSGVITNPQSGSVISYRTSEFCGISITGGATPDESLSNGGPC